MYSGDGPISRFKGIIPMIRREVRKSNISSKRRGFCVWGEKVSKQIRSELEIGRKRRKTLGGSKRMTRGRNGASEVSQGEGTNRHLQVGGGRSWAEREQRITAYERGEKMGAKGITAEGRTKNRSEGEEVVRIRREERQMGVTKVNNEWVNQSSKIKKKVTKGKSRKRRLLGGGGGNGEAEVVENRKGVQTRSARNQLGQKKSLEMECVCRGRGQETGRGVAER